MFRNACKWVFAAALAMTLVTRARAAFENEVHGEGMGNCVALDGDTLAVGACLWNHNQGRVYVFKRSAGGSWQQTAVLTASDGAQNYSFGNCVGLSGDWLIVGSQWHGRVYFFKRNLDESWTERANLASTYEYARSHGASVAIDGSFAVAGDPSAGMVNEGAITVYQRVGDVWNVYVCRTHNPNGWVRSLGFSVDIRTLGNIGYVVAGAPESYLDNDHTDHFYGRAFSFFAMNNLLAGTEIVCSDVANQNYFGNSVSIDFNDRGVLSAAVGACLTGDGQIGAAYVFDFGAILWTQLAKLTPPIYAHTMMRYGASLALRNDVLAVVGVWNLDWPEYIPGYNAPVYLYDRNRGGPNQWGLFNEVRSQTFDQVGNQMDFGGGDTLNLAEKGIALRNGRIAVAAPTRTYLDGGVQKSGAAFVFDPGALAAGARPAAAGVRLSEIVDDSPSNHTCAAYIELYNPANVYVSLADTQLVIENPLFGAGKKGGENVAYYRFPSTATIPSNSCLLVSLGAFKDEFEHHWGTDLDTASFDYEIGDGSLWPEDGCVYRLEQINRGTVPNPDTTNAVDASVACPGGCRTVHGSTASDDWRFDNCYMASPGAIDWDQFRYSTRALPFLEDWSGYGFASNNWTVTSSTAGKTNWLASYPNAYAQFYYLPNRSTGFRDSLISPLLSGFGKSDVRLDCVLQLDMFSGNNKGYTVDVHVVSADWSSTNTVATFTDAYGDHTWTNRIDITTHARDNYFRIMFRSIGKNSNYLNAWYFDNICVTGSTRVAAAPTITSLQVNPSSPDGGIQMFWAAGSNGRLHRVFYGTNLLEGINRPLGVFGNSSFLMQPLPEVGGSPSVFFRVESLP